MAPSRGNPRRTAQAVEREGRILQWLFEGQTTTEIARREGVTQRRISQIITRANLRRISPLVDECRAAQLGRIQIATRELFELARNPKASFTARALAYGTIKAWADREAKLMGLDMPARSEIRVLTEDAVDAAIHDLQAELALKSQ
ncbi:MAG TPA: hypothetical protein VH141_32725, partial [Pseudonocardia sp.]|nr:hypothetical protein [Pseudonocardia sp.]